MIPTLYEPFRHWSDGGSVYILSDLHFEELIYWIGYIYRYWHYVTGESSKEIIKLAPVKVMKQNYERLYLMTPEEVIEMLKVNN